MVDITGKQFIIMGLLCEGPNHPYGLDELIRERNMREWTNIGKSSIYRLLNELEQLFIDDTKIPPEILEIKDYNKMRDFDKKPLVQHYEDEVDGRVRKVFSLTSDGMYVLREKIFTVISRFLGRYDENQYLFGDEDLYVGFVYIDILPKTRQIEALSISVKRMENHIVYLQEKLLESKEKPFCVTGLFIHPIMILKTDIEFFNMIIEKIQKGERFLDVDKWL